MNPQNRQLFVIIVHYGQPVVTQVALEALWSGKSVPTTVIVIDHGETPFLQEDSRNTHVIRPAINAGYGAGVNLGLGALLSRGAQANDIIVVMNNDVVVAPESLLNLRHWWHEHPEPALVGVCVEERGHTVYGGGRVNAWTGRANLITDYPAYGRDPAGGGGNLDYIHGAFVAAPYAVLLATHGFPEEYFLYWEDVYVSRRAVARGIPLRLAQNVQVQHRETPMTPSPQQRYYLIRNGARFMAEQTPFPLSLWWRMFNRLRLLYHKWHPASPHRLTYQALHAAITRQTGEHTLV